MARTRTEFRCGGCGATAPRWTGRCPVCGSWNTLEEAPAVPRGGLRQAGVGHRPPCPPVELLSVPADDDLPVPTGLDELDRVLGGGLTPSSVTLLAGEPGMGKSTLLLQMLASLSARGLRTLLVSAEESPSQVRRRAARLGLLAPGMWVAGETDLGAIRALAADLRPAVMVVDSIQTICCQSAGSGAAVPVAGSVTQVRECAQALTDDAKAGGPATVLVGHVTKDGSIAGPRVLEHVVDTVMSFEGDRHEGLRVLRAVKHRFGPVGELGMWEMTAEGLAPVRDAAGYLLADRRTGVPGSVVFAALDGRRPLLVEVQALVGSPSAVPGPPRRSSTGYPVSRLGQLLAVLERRAGLALGRCDVYVSAVGGMRLDDPGADLAVALAVASAATCRVLADDLVAVGEIGLGGELRRVPHTDRRLAEAERFGFRHAVIAARSMPAGPSHASAAVPTATAAAATSTSPATGVTSAQPVLRAPGITIDRVAGVADALERHLGRPAPAARLHLVGSGSA